MPPVRNLNLILLSTVLIAVGVMWWFSRRPMEVSQSSAVVPGTPVLTVITVPGRISAADGSRSAFVVEDTTGKVTITMSPAGTERMPFSRLKFTSTSSVNFDGRGHWFACFDGGGRFFYGMPGIWVNRLDETADSTSAQTLPKPEAEALFRQLKTPPGGG